MITREICPPEPYRPHPLAQLFPRMDDQQFRDLVEDIKANGVREPIVFYDGQVLDGRHRYLAAREACVEYPRTEYTGGDPMAFVVSANLHRRHLSESQRAMVAAKIANTTHGQSSRFSGDRQAEKPNEIRTAPQGANCPVTNQDAAEMLNVSKRSVVRARHVIDRAEPEVSEAVESGSLSVSLAHQVADLPPQDQRDIVSKPNPRDMRDAARQALSPKPRREIPVITPDPKPTKEEKSEAQKVKDIFKAINELPSPDYLTGLMRRNGIMRRQFRMAIRTLRAIGHPMGSDPLEGDALEFFRERCKDGLKKYSKDEPGFELLISVLAAYNRGSCPTEKQIKAAEAALADRRIRVDSLIEDD